MSIFDILVSKWVSFPKNNDVQSTTDCVRCAMPHHASTPTHCTLEFLVDYYLAFRANCFYTCLNKKYSIGDCIAGCNNCARNLQNKSKGLIRNPHQRYLPFKDWLNAFKKLGLGNVLGQYTSFEELYSDIADALRSINNIGHLGYYDTSLRIGYWYTPQRIMPVSKVYLQSGALTGARWLQNKGYLKNVDLSNKYAIVDLNEFPAIMRNMSFMGLTSAILIEDFLCVCKDDIYHLFG
jgi:hypothetical protein